MILSFSNPGEIDPLLITTLGVNVKEGGSPIGFFGTGLKYAIAIALRLGDEITIQSGETQYQFRKVPKTIRGKDFNFIEMSGPETSQTLGFTTELGKTWEPWMAYRELRSNAQDESGVVEMLSSWPEPTPGTTRVLLRGDHLPKQHAEGAQFFLSAPELFNNSEVAIHQGATNFVYYKGIAVARYTKPFLFTYNLLTYVELTEDRTIKHWDYQKPKIYRAWAQCELPALLSRALKANQTVWEHELDFDTYGVPLGDTFVEEVEKLAQNRIGDVNASAVIAVKALRQSNAKPLPAKLTPVEFKMLESALAFCAKLGVTPTHEIVVSEGLGSGVLGMAMDDTIWLSREVFRQGTKRLAGTIIEEHLHLSKGFADGSRALQNHLLDWVVSLGEDLQGEPL